MCWLPQCAPRRRAADESGVGAATSVLASSRSPACSPSRVGARLTNKALCQREAAVLVSRRTAPRATHSLPAERLRDDGYLRTGTRKTMLVSFCPASFGIEAELVPQRQP